MEKKYEIRYSYGKWNCVASNFSDFDDAYAHYKTIKRAKALWDVTSIPELLLSSKKSGHGGKTINLTDLI